jgi:hypothetical protein
MAIPLCGFAQNESNIKILSDGPIKFYKTISTNAYFIENVKLKSGQVQLEYLGEPFTLNLNRAKLLVIFEDCVNTRTKASKSDMTEARIIQLVNDYYNCETFTTSFELSESEKTEQKYSTQKSVINYDIGFGYYSETLDFSINSLSKQSKSEGGFSLYASFNISPSHLGSLTGRLFYDFSLQYNLGNSFEFSGIEKDLSSLLITLTPKYYFSKPQSKFNPFLGASFGAIVLDYDITDNSAILFDNVDSSKTKFIYGIEIGAEILNNFEFTISYFPDYKYDIFIDEETTLRSRFQNLAFKMGYKF